MAPYPPRDRRGFKIALICALGVEADAVHDVFDKFWKDEGINYSHAEEDHNSYATGAIGEHNVVLVYLSGTGKVSASIAGAGLRSSFPSIKLALVVGICGGVPFIVNRKTRVYLGDLIISTALIQHDFVRQYPYTREQKDTLEDRFGRPSDRIRAHLKMLQTSLHRQAFQQNIMASLDDLVTTTPGLQHPGYKTDRLYEPMYVHQHHLSADGHNCSQCNEFHICDAAKKLDCSEVGCESAKCSVRNDPEAVQQEYSPQVYFGTVGSGDTVIKSGFHRDKIAEKYDIVAFEMEGAGVWDQFPTIILKAVCDYADSHKNKDWQRWTAFVAAAGVKAFLMMWSADEDPLASNKRKARTMSQHGCEETVPSPVERLDEEILASLSFEQMFERKNNVRAPHGQTCEWIFHTAAYKDWVAQRSGLLWIKGKPGAGKSTLMAFLYEHLHRKRRPDHGIHLEFFFSARGNELQRTPLGMLRSLINQIFRQDPVIRNIVRKPYQEKKIAFGRVGSDGGNSWVWQRRELEDLLVDTVSRSARENTLTIFVDALDEAGEESARDMARYFHSMNTQITEKSGNAKICISCRHYPIVSRVRGIEICVEDHNRNDIAAFVRDHLQIQGLSSEHMPYYDSWLSMEDFLVKRADGVFQWVCLILPMVEKAMDDGEPLAILQQQLQELPDELGQVYEHILQKVIDPRYRSRSLSLFQWVCLAVKPLSVTELRYALAAYDSVTLPLSVRCHDVRDFIAKDELVERKIRAWSGGLVEVVENSDASTALVQVIHQSVNDFVVSRGLSLLMGNQTNVPAKFSTHDRTSQASDVIYVGHASLYKSCLHYLLREGEIARKEIELLKNTRKYGYISTESVSGSPLIRYTIQNLFVHAEKAMYKRSDFLEQEVQLLDQVILHWNTVHQDLFSHERYRPNPGTTILHASAAAGLKDIAQYLVRSGIDINIRDERGRTALHDAAGTGQLSMVKWLYHAGSELAAVANWGDTAMVMAAASGHSDIVEWFLGRDAHSKPSISESSSALIEAASAGHVHIIQLLLRAGADVDHQDEQGESPLSAASERGDLEVIQLLLDNKANVNTQVRGRRTLIALQIACLEGGEEVIELLLDRGANINAQGGFWGTALQAACIGGSEEVVELLLNRGADVNIQRGKYGSALQAAAIQKDGEDMVQLLLDHRADVNLNGGRYGTALQGASCNGFQDIVQLLLDHDADVNIQGGRYGSALQAASCKGFGEIVQILLDHGADVNIQGGYYGCALQAASSNNHQDLAQQLLDLGAILPQGNNSPNDIDPWESGSNNLYSSDDEDGMDQVENVSENPILVNLITRRSNSSQDPLHSERISQPWRTGRHMDGSYINKVFSDNFESTNPLPHLYPRRVEARGLEGFTDPPTEMDSHQGEDQEVDD